MVKQTSAYRIYCVPEKLQRTLVDTSSPEVQNLLRRPSHLRPNSFGYRGLNSVRPTSEGLRGTGETAEQELIVLENGYIELSCPVRNALFQWRREESGFGNTDWLYPYAVVEMPISFLRLARDLYSSAGLTSQIRVAQEYRNIRGFLLVAGHPASPLFGREKRLFDEQDLIGKTRVVGADFNPEKLARELIAEAYLQFGFDTDAIPEIEEAWMQESV